MADNKFTLDLSGRRTRKIDEQLDQIRTEDRQNRANDARDEYIRAQLQEIALQDIYDRRQREYDNNQKLQAAADNEYWSGRRFGLRPNEDRNALVNPAPASRFDPGWLAAPSARDAQEEAARQQDLAAETLAARGGGTLLSNEELERQAAQYTANANRANAAAENLQRQRIELGRVAGQARTYGYEKNRNAPDFADLSRYQTTATGEGREVRDLDYNTGKTTGGTHREYEYGDLAYDFINQNRDAAAQWSYNAVRNNAGLLGMDNRELRQMTPDEIAMFNYLYAKDSQLGDQDHKNAYDYIRFIQSDPLYASGDGTLNARQRAEETEQAAAFAQAHPVAASAGTVLANPLKAITYLSQAADFIDDGKMETDAGYNRYSYIPTAIRDTVSKEVEQKWSAKGKFAGKAATFAYQTGMSMADFLFNTAITGGFAGGGVASEALALSLMGTEAAADATMAAKDRGLDDAQAFAIGTIAGAAEIITEKFSIEALLNNVGRAGLSYWLKNAFTEGAEEIGSDFINLMADILIAKDKGEWQAAIDAYVAKGYTKEEAAGRALGDQAAQMGVSFLGGALSGGVMGGAGAVRIGFLNSAQGADYRAEARQNGTEMEALRALAEAGLQSGDAETARLAQNMQGRLDAGKRIPDRAVGRLAYELDETLGETEDEEPAAGPSFRQELNRPRSIEEYAARQTGRPYTRYANETFEEAFRTAETPAAEARPTLRSLNTDQIDRAAASFGKEGGAALRANYNSEVSPSEYFRDFSRFYNAGITGRSTETMDMGVLTPEQRVAAYEAGAKDQTATAKATASANVGFHDSTGLVGKSTSAVLDKLAKLTRTSIEIDPNVDDLVNGQIIGNRIILQKASDFELIKTAKHEITHRLQELAPEAYKTYRDFALNTLAENGDVDALVRRYQQDYKRVGQNLSPAQAMDEIAADFTEALVTEAEKGSTEIFAKLAAHDAKAASGFVRAIRDFIARVKRAFSGRQADEVSRNTFGVGLDKLEQAAKLWDDLLNEGEQAAQGIGVEANENAASEETAGKFSTKAEVLALQGVDWVGNKVSIKTQLQKHENELNQMAPVAVVEFNGIHGSLVGAMMREVSRVGGQRMKRGSVVFEFNEDGAKEINRHAKAAELQAAALAAPYVAKYGKLVAGQKNHEGTGLTTITYAAPVIINKDTVNVGVVIQFEANGKPRAVNVAYQSGKPFKIDMKKASKGLDSRVNRYGQGTSLPTMDAFDNKVTQPGENVKKYSLKKLDSDYLAAVNSGDMETAQRMVDEAAKAAGYKKETYHGTNADFTVFHEYGGNEIGYHVGTKAAANERILDAKDARVLRLYTKLGNKIQMPDVFGLWHGVHDYVSYVLGEPISDEDLDFLLNVKKATAKYKNADIFKKNEAFYEMRDKVKDAVVHEYKRSYIQEAVKAQREYMLSLGIDTVAYKNRYEDAGNTSYMLFHANQVKSADPVTYDDAGNVIPLSERFNQENPDIRYSIKNIRDGSNYSKNSLRNSPLETMQQAEAAQRALERENNDLRERVAYWKGQTRRSTGVKTNPAEVRRAARRIARYYSSDADITAELQELYDWIANGGQDVSGEEANRRARAIADKVVDSALETEAAQYDMYGDLRDYLRRTELTISPEDRANIQDYNDWRKQYFGRMNLKGGSTNIDSVYMEMSELWPELFPDSITHPADQLLQIAEVADQIYTVTEHNPFAGYEDEAAVGIANEILETFFDLPQVKPTFADYQARKLAAEKAKGAEKLRALRAQKNEQIERITRTERDKRTEQADRLRWQRDEAIAKLREQNRETVRRALERSMETRERQLNALKDRYARSQAKSRDARSAREMRGKILRHSRALSEKLMRPTDKAHIPEVLQKPVAELLAAINQESLYSIDRNGKRVKNDSGDPTKRTQAFRALKERYEQILKKPDEFEGVIDPDLMDNLTDVIAMKDVKLAEMSLSQLDTVWKTLKGVEASVNTWNKTFAAARFATVSEAAEAIREANEDKQGRTQFRGLLGRAQTLTRVDMMTPEAYFHRLGKPGDALFREMRNAQDKQITILKAVSDFTTDALKGTDARKLEQEMHTVTLGGENVQLSTAQLMELYVLMRREQARQHILVGGILPEAVDTKGLKKVSRAEPVRGITVEEIADATSKLTSKQRAVAEALQGYASTELSRYGNEASMQVYGYRKFGEEFYWPIRSNKQEVKTEIGKDIQAPTVSNKGMTKLTVPNANNSVLIGSIFDTFTQHSTEMATYAAWLAASEDVNRVRNFTFRDDADGERVPTGSVKGILDRVYGSGGSEYLGKLLADIANGVNNGDAGLFDQFTGNYKASAVGANLRVIIQQPTAILRALDMIDLKYMTSGLAANPLRGWRKATEYAPIAQWKDWGYFDVSTGRSMKDVMFQATSRLEKARNAMMAPAGWADSVSWGYLWNAVEREVRATTDLTGAEFDRAVAARFTEIVDRTQVVDGILQRSQIMRKGGINKMATAFMAEPTKQYNMLLTSAYDARHSSGAAKRAAKIRLARTAAALLASGVVNAAAQSFVDALRDSDREKDYWEKWMDAFIGDVSAQNTFGENLRQIFLVGNLGSQFMPLNYIPYIKDFVSLIQGYDVGRMDMESISSFIKAALNLNKALNGEGKLTTAGALANIFGEASRMLGIPAANARRDAEALAAAIIYSSGNYVAEYRYEKWSKRQSSNRNTFYDILYNAYKNDFKAFNIIYNDMLAGGEFVTSDKSAADAIASAMESRMKEEAGVSSGKDLANRFTPDVQVEIAAVPNAESAVPDEAQQKEAEAEKEQSKEAIREADRKAAEARANAAIENNIVLTPTRIAYNERVEKIRDSALWPVSGLDDREEILELIDEMTSGSGDRGKGALKTVAAGADVGMTEDLYLLYDLAWHMADKANDGNGSLKQSEFIEAMKNVDMTPEQRTFLWNRKWKPGKMPDWTKPKNQW